MKLSINHTARLNYFLLILAFFVSFTGCKKDDQFSGSDTESFLAFNFATKSDISVKLNVKDLSGNSVSGVMVRLYLENPYQEKISSLKPGLVPNIKGVTDANGSFTTSMAIPTYVTKLYAIVDGYDNPMVYDVIKTGIVESIYPRGFAKRFLQARAYPTGYNPKVYDNQNSNYALTGAWILGNYSGVPGDDDGRPSFIDIRESIPTGLITQIGTTLAEVPNNIPDNHPQFIDNSNKANLKLVDNCNVWITFVSEGAGYQNCLGYFYYKTADGAPSRSSDLFKKIIIFPNSSASGSNGALVQGDRVKLMFCDPSADPNVTSNWTDVFPAGYTVGWFLSSNGYGAYPSGTQFTNFAYNDQGLSQSVLLYSAEYEKIVLGIEDIRRSTGGGSDNDFNDCVFNVAVNPITAVDITQLNSLNSGLSDSDGDGVNDVVDEYPTDPERAFNNYYPGASTYGTLAFEDNWPNKGDYDCNDLVVDYRVTYVTNAAGTVKDVILNSRVAAIGALYLNGFAWELNANQSNVESIATTYLGPGTLLGGSLFTLHAKGYETGQNSAKVVVPFFDNAYTLFGFSSAVSSYINVNPLATQYNPVSITKKITFVSPVTLASLGSLPYNPFLVVNQNRGKEVHKPGLPGTSKANSIYYNTSDDKTNQNNLWYVGLQRYPWVLDTPVKFEYPVEDERNNPTDYNLSKGYKHYDNWVTNNGVSYADWYSTNSGEYRNNSYIYPHRK
ncbi:MAG: LruC domain-containing protein [Bacteroidales bacterium]